MYLLKSVRAKSFGMSYKVVLDGKDHVLMDLSADHQENNVPGAKGRYISEKGNRFLFYDIKGASFPIAYRKYSIQSESIVELSGATAVLEVYLMLAGSQKQRGEIGGISLQPTQFTIRYQPQLNNRSWLKHGEYAILSIGITDKVFTRLLRIHPELAILDEKVRQKEAYSFTMNPFANANMLDAAKAILQCTLVGIPRRLYLDTCINSFLQQALQLVIRANNTSTVTATDLANHSKVLTVAGIITDNPEGDHTPTGLSRRVLLSVSVLTKEFKKKYGITIHQFIIHRRMEKATYLLNNSTISISVIAEIVGYRDSATFTHTFKKIYGLPPSAVRQQRTAVN